MSCADLVPHAFRSPRQRGFGLTGPVPRSIRPTPGPRFTAPKGVRSEAMQASRGVMACVGKPGKVRKGGSCFIACSSFSRASVCWGPHRRLLRTKNMTTAIHMTRFRRQPTGTMNTATIIPMGLVTPKGRTEAMGTMRMTTIILTAQPIPKNEGSLGKENPWGLVCPIFGLRSRVRWLKRREVWGWRSPHNGARASTGGSASIGR